MTIRTSASCLALLTMVGLPLVACRDTSTGDDVQQIDAPVNTSMHIQDVQNDSLPAGSPVALHGVVVTAIDTYGNKTGDIWVEEPDGGEFSGIHVFGAPTAQVAMLAVGDIVDIAGAEKDEFALSTDTSGNTTTELKGAAGGTMTVSKTGTGTVPAAKVLDALAIGQLATPELRNAEWEKWEGVLVTVNNVSALNKPSQIGGTTPDPTFKKFEITGGVYVESSLADFGTVAAADCLASTTGVMDYFFDYLILPRSTAEVAGGGSACPAAETACTDGIDNDGNLFGDCQDNGCIIAESTCHVATTISAIQAAVPTGGIQLQNVYVMALSAPSGSGAGTPKNMWVSTNPTASAGDGVYVFGNGDDLSGFTVGSTVNIIGTATEYNNDTMGGTLTEVKALQITAGTPAGAAVALQNQSAATLTTAVGGAPLESVLVEMRNVKVTVIGTTSGTGTANTHGVGSLVQGGITFLSDDDIFLLPAGELNKCYASITGIWTYQVFSNAYGFLPRAVGTGVGTCN